eukprot:gene17073-biopygen9812
MVLMMDAGLVAGARAAVQRVVVVAVLVWLAVERVEAVSRFGLYRATCLGEKRGAGCDDYIIQVCDCAAPPCATQGAFHWVGMALVFVVDYVLTRGFATRMRDREAALEASIDAAEDVGVGLAAYDTDAARALVDGEEGEALPPRLRTALRELVDNLQSYQPYRNGSGRNLLEAPARTRSAPVSPPGFPPVSIRVPPGLPRAGQAPRSLFSGLPQRARPSFCPGSVSGGERGVGGAHVTAGAAGAVVRRGAAQQP